MGFKSFMQATGKALGDGLVVIAEVTEEMANASAEAQAREIVLKGVMADARAEGKLVEYIYNVLQTDSYSKNRELQGIAVWCREKKFTRAAEAAEMGICKHGSIFEVSSIFGPDTTHNLEMAKIVVGSGCAI